ncbi:MAG TPA: PaaI family thioesterase [Baekduia sp.]|nr:PaaI family thioesterase [Baekduia sp.]
MTSEAQTIDWGTPRTREITWYSPATITAAAAELSGRQVLEAISEGRLPPPPMAELVGARLVLVGDGEVRFAWTPDESAYNPIGMIHGGLLCTLLDFAAGAAVQTKLPAGAASSSIEIKVSYLKALRSDSGDIDVHGHVLQVGRHVAFAEAHARNPAGELVGHATTSLAVLAA